MKVAIASSDGKRVDEPFGCARKFYIYEVGEKIALLEVRKVEILEHDHEARIRLISDCDLLLAVKIGCTAVDALFFSKIYPLAIDREEIQKALERLRPRIASFRLREKFD